MRIRIALTLGLLGTFFLPWEGISFADTSSPSLPTTSLPIPDINSILPKGLANAFITSIGLGMDHHSYEPATPLGTAFGFDVGVEVTVAHPPDSLLNSISSSLSAFGAGAGTGSSLSSISGMLVLPSAKIHIHKGITDFLDVGISALPSIASLPFLSTSSFYGAEAKACFWHPEEGLSFSFRASYNVNTLNYGPLLITTTTITPQIIASKKMEFADPYIGVAFQYTFGGMQMTIPVPALPPPLPTIAPLILTQTGSGYGANLFGGVSLRVPIIGFKITLEGAYSTAQVSYIGTKIGFSF